MSRFIHINDKCYPTTALLQNLNSSDSISLLDLREVGNLLKINSYYLRAIYLGPLPVKGK